VAERVADVDPGLQATRAADSAASAAGLDVKELKDMNALDQAAQLFQQVWNPEEPIVSASMLRALSHAGNYVAGAYIDGQLLGALVGFFGSRSGRLELHSHVLGVLEHARGRKVGFALKQHQRAWSLGRGIDSVTWTFDPLVRRNAYFNLTKLGARITAYYENFYGSMDDGINAADDTDRVLVTWDLAGPEAIEASERGSTGNGTEVGDTGPAKVLYSDEHGAPVTRTSDQPRILAWIPEDIVAIRAGQIDLARAWRRALRETVGSALGDGYVATGMSRDGWLMLGQPDR
jgi:predicted GNAT superfamily acetyltransferase